MNTSLKDIALSPEVLDSISGELVKKTAELKVLQGTFDIEFLFQRTASSMVIVSLCSLYFTFNDSWYWILSVISTILFFIISRAFLIGCEDSVNKIAECMAETTLIACEKAFEVHQLKNRK